MLVSSIQPVHGSNLPLLWVIALSPHIVGSLREVLETRAAAWAVQSPRYFFHLPRKVTQVELLGHGSQFCPRRHKFL